MSGLFRTVPPLLQRGAIAVGKEALRAGMSVVSDVALKPLKESLRTCVRESGENLKRIAEEKIDTLMERMRYNPAIPLTALQSFNEARNVRKRRKVPRKKTSTCKKNIRKKIRKIVSKPKKKIVKIKRSRMRS